MEMEGVRYKQYIQSMPSSSEIMNEASVMRINIDIYTKEKPGDDSKATKMKAQKFDAEIGQEFNKQMNYEQLDR